MLGFHPYSQILLASLEKILSPCLWLHQEPTCVVPADDSISWGLLRCLVFILCFLIFQTLFLLSPVLLSLFWSSVLKQNKTFLTFMWRSSGRYVFNPCSITRSVIIIIIVIGPGNWTQDLKLTKWTLCYWTMSLAPEVQWCCFKITF